MSSPCLLVLDAATETVHLALAVGQGELIRALPGGATASATLLPAIEALLADAGLGMSRLDAVGFGRGPGAFTGLRTACSIAQGLAMGAGCPVLALDTLAAVAESAHRQGAGEEVWAATDARMGEIYAARWRRRAAGDWLALEPASLYSPAGLVAAIRSGLDALTVQASGRTTPAVALGGNALDVPALTDALEHAELPRVTRWRDAAPDGAALAALARVAWTNGALLDPALALPLYVRDKVALTTAERAAAAGVKG